MSKFPSSLSWRDFGVGPDELSLDLTLNMGQCFNWKKMERVEEACWVGMVAHRPFIMKQTPTSTEYINLSLNSASDVEIHNIIKRYYQLDHSLNSLYVEWGEGCDRMKEVTRYLKGARVVRQDPWECLISFICSSNNNIPRITQMLEKLRRRYGKYVCTVRAVTSVDSLAHQSFELPINFSSTHNTADLENYKWIVDFTPRFTTEHNAPTTSTSASATQSYELYEFPSVFALAEASEEELRGLGMGYRAKFIINSAKLVRSKCLELMTFADRSDENGVDSGAVWFEHLRSLALQARCAVPTEAIGVIVKLENASGRIIKKEYQENIVIKSECDSSCMASAGIENSDEASRGIDQARLQVQTMLLELPGVGRKVADCVALFSLDQTSAVPVDTHVWNIAIRDYAPQLRRAPAKTEPGNPDPEVYIKTEANYTPAEESVPTTPGKGKGRGKRAAASPATSGPQVINSPPFASPSTPITPGDVDSIETRSLTPAVYEAVGGEFRRRFGLHAGWAHSVLFAAELGIFKDRLPISMQNEMKAFADLQRSAKKVKREEKAEAL